MGFFEIYKRGQGTAARWATAAALGAFAIFGCYELNDRLSGRGGITVYGATVDIGLLITAIVFTGCGLAIAWVVNAPKSVDFLIVTEAELRKVSWPTRQELWKQTVIVLVAVVLIGTLILAADVILMLLMRGVKVLPSTAEAGPEQARLARPEHRSIRAACTGAPVDRQARWPTGPLIGLRTAVVQPEMRARSAQVSQDEDGGPDRRSGMPLAAALRSPWSRA